MVVFIERGSARKIRMRVFGLLMIGFERGDGLEMVDNCQSECRYLNDGVV
jgi:hypothetical protein